MTDIKALRERAGWKQHQMADYLGVAQPTISRLETGRQKPTGPVRRLLSALEVRLQDRNIAAPIEQAAA